jgi:hypothetical protein
MGCRPKLGFTLLLQIDLQAYHVTRPAGMVGGGGCGGGGAGGGGERSRFFFISFSKVGRQEHKIKQNQSEEEKLNFKCYACLQIRK